MRIEKVETKIYIYDCVDCERERRTEHKTEAERAVCHSCGWQRERVQAQKDVEFMVGAIVTNVDVNDNASEILSLWIRTKDGRKVER